MNDSDQDHSWSHGSRQGPRWRSGLGSSSCGQRLGGFLAAFTLLSVVFFGSAGQARAYTDPGSGALIWQMLVAGFVGAMFYFRRFISWFKRRRDGSRSDEPVATSERHRELSGSKK